ncbi:MAG TPA: GNAT family N-acetyltransferase [Streptosporangiaceae bacterium]
MNIRRIADGDLLELTDMFARCSRQTIYRRFHGYLRAFPEPYFSDAVKGAPGHVALVAQSAGQIVALASSVTLDDGSCEIGILVEDGYQRQRIGSRMLERLVAHAGTRTVRATIQPDQRWIVPVLLRHENIRIVLH